MLIGLVGAPNKGKSTFFAASTLIPVKIADYPFTTIDANEGIAYLTKRCVCKELGVACTHELCVNGTRLIPVKLVDVAGIVPEAHKGKGMGLSFLDKMREASVLIQVVDASGKTDAEGNATNFFDPAEEITFLEREINEWFYSILNRNWQKVMKKARLSKQHPIDALKEILSGLGIDESKIREAINSVGIDESEIFEMDEMLLKNFASKLRELSKPIVIAANKIDKDGAKENYEKLVKKFPDKTIVPVSAEAELTLRKASKAGLIDYFPGEGDFRIKGTLSDQQRKALEYIKERVLQPFGSTGVQRCLNTAVFDVLKYVVVYPVENENRMTDTKGNVLPDAILMPRDSTILDLAEKIHSDIAEGFIKGIDVRTKRAVGKDYVLKDNDVVKIVWKK